MLDLNVRAGTLLLLLGRVMALALRDLSAGRPASHAGSARVCSRGSPTSRRGACSCA